MIYNGFGRWLSESEKTVVDAFNNKYGPMKKRSNWEIVLRGLSEHITIELGKHVYRMIKAGDPIVTASGTYESDHDVLCHVLTCEKDGVESELTFPCEITLNELIRISDSLSEEEIMNIVFATSMTKLKR